MANLPRSISTSNPDCNVDSDAEHSPHGLLNIAKPIGMTSRDVVNQVVRLLRARFPKPARLPKVGHAGTLDPLASGVLVIGVGAGVRLVPYLHRLDKVYHATFRLGQSSVSGDLEMPLEEESDPVRPTRQQIDAAVIGLTGLITQIPPAHSAIKIGGRKAYRFAHKGQAVEVPPRVVRVDEIQVVRYEYPDVELIIRCGTGTYIRTLGIDLAKACGTTAVMTALSRTRIGGFHLADAVAPEQLHAEALPLETFLQPLAIAVPDLVQVSLDDEPLERLCHGLRIETEDPLSGEAEPEFEGASETSAPEAVEVAVFDLRGRLRAIAYLQDGRLHPKRVFPAC